jgi:stearoyl-CoA desaturase (delta-9 desaturase)
LLTLGEGNHGFHHAFPTSYKNGVKWYQYDPTKWLIEIGSLFGLCYELSHPTENEIQKARYQVSEKKLNVLGKTIDWPSQPSGYMNFQDVTEAVAMGRKLLIVGDKVCDVSGFQKEHPGGAGLIQSMIGKDADTTLKAMDTRHTHTKAAKNIMDNITVALYKEY